MIAAVIIPAAVLGLVFAALLLFVAGLCEAAGKRTPKNLNK